MGVADDLTDILEVSDSVAIEVAEKIFENGLAGIKISKELPAFIRGKMYEQKYRWLIMNSFVQLSIKNIEVRCLPVYSTWWKRHP